MKKWFSYLRNQKMDIRIQRHPNPKSEPTTAEHHNLMFNFSPNPQRATIFNYFTKPKDKEIKYPRKMYTRHVNEGVKKDRKDDYEARNKVLDNLLKMTDEIPEKLYKFPFKNLVLVGGGADELAYCGVASALEEHDILENIDKFTGISGGAIAAALLATGFKSNDLKQFISSIKDASVEQLKLELEDLFDKKDKRNISFEEVYISFGKELNIIVPNENKEWEEYCNRETTSKMPILDAVCRSLSFPCEWLPFIYHIFDDKCLCICGATQYLDEVPPESCEEPITCETGNLETLGYFVYSEKDYQTLREQIETQCNVAKSDQQKSKEASQCGKKDDNRLTKLYTEILKAQTFCLQIFKGKNEILIEDFKRNLTQSKEAEQYGKMLFGEAAIEETIFEAKLETCPKEVTIGQLLKYFEGMRCSVLYKFIDLKLGRKELGGPQSLMATMINTVVKSSKEQSAIGMDGSYTWHFEMLDFAMKNDDKMFMLDHGKRTTEKFLMRFKENSYLPSDNDVH